MIDTKAIALVLFVAGGCGADLSLVPPPGWGAVAPTDPRAAALTSLLPPALRLQPSVIFTDGRGDDERAVGWGEVVRENLELDDNRVLMLGRQLARAYDGLLGAANRFTLGEQRLVDFAGVEAARLTGRYDERAVTAFLLPGEGQHARVVFDVPARRADELAPVLEAAARQTGGLSSSFLGRYAIELAVFALLFAGLAWMILVYRRHKRAVRAHDAY